MGQKVNPVGLRVGINRNWESRWYADKEFATYLHEDIKIRKYLDKKLYDAAFLQLKSKEKRTMLKSQFTLLVQVLLSVKMVRTLRNLRNQLLKLQKVNLLKLMLLKLRIRI